MKTVNDKLRTLFNLLALMNLMMSVTMAIYIDNKVKKEKKQSKTSIKQKTNEVVSKVAPVPEVKRWIMGFHSDKVIQHYLQAIHMPMMIWQCQSAIQPYWGNKPIPVLELYCETIGTLEKVTWYHNWKEVKIGGRYEQIIMPHYYKGRYFSRWLDFRLLIYNAMPNDSGVYSFKAESPNGYSEQQLVYVDSSRKRKRGRLARNRLARNRP